jgi:hypothetical protein
MLMPAFLHGDDIRRARRFVCAQRIGNAQVTIASEDMLRAVVGMSYMHDQPGWQKSVLRFVEVFVDGLRIRPVKRRNAKP